MHGWKTVVANVMALPRANVLVGKWASLWGRLRWMPFLLLLVWLGGRGVVGLLEWDLAHLVWAGLLWTAWLIARGLWPLAALFALVLTPLGWQLGGWPTGGALDDLQPGSYMRLEGTVRQVDLTGNRGRPRLSLLLGEAKVMAEGNSWRPLEVRVNINLPGSQRPRLYRRQVRVGGRLASAGGWSGAPRYTLEGAAYHLQALPTDGAVGEGLRTALADRAAYYLAKAPLAVYHPILLGVRERGSPEAWRVAETANRIGIAHLFAISGLHIGLLFLIFAGSARFLLQFVLPRQGWLRAGMVIRIGVVSVIWGYIALIGFPIPAVRAAVMGTMLVWSDLWGTRTPRLYVLLLAALVLLVTTPTALYDLSFQLSFLGYFFLTCGLGLSSLVGGVWDAREQGWWARGLRMTGINLWVTLWITLGMWPLISLKFGNFSLLVFAGNLILIPFLSLLILPVGLLALGVNFISLGSPPGGWVERGVFAVLEPLLLAWIWVTETIDWLGSGLVFPLRLTWHTQQIFLYYAFLLTGVYLLIRMARARSGGGFPLPRKEI